MGLNFDRGIRKRGSTKSSLPILSYYYSSRLSNTRIKQFQFSYIYLSTVLHIVNLKLVLQWTKLVLVLFIVNLFLVQCSYGAKMVRLCIASVDPIKLSSQCIMCNRRDFPLTVIDCTGMTQVRELVSNPLSVDEATCLILNCRRQVPEAKPEPYRGTVTQALRANNLPAAAGSRLHEIRPLSAMFGAGPYAGASAVPFSRHSAYSNSIKTGPFMAQSATGGAHRAGFVNDGAMAPSNQQVLPYALVPAPFTSPFGLRKYKAALVPLFK